MQIICPGSAILIGSDPLFGHQRFKLDPAGYSIGFHVTAVGQKQQELEAMNHLEKKWKKLDNGKGGEDATKAHEVHLWTLDPSQRLQVFVGDTQCLFYMPLQIITSPEKLE